MHRKPRLERKGRKHFKRLQAHPTAQAKEKEPEKPTSSETEKKKKDEKPKLTLTWDNVQEA